MASQSPTDEAQVDDYRAGWVAASRLMDEGASWSGHERNCAYLNLGDGSFANVSAVAGFDFADDGRAAALVDWDGDGAVDAWIKNRTSPALRFLRNQVAVGESWVALRLVGTECNRDAVGARVELVAGGRRYVREVRVGSGYLAQSSAWLHFGLGDDEPIESCVVRWPGGGEQRVQGLRPGARFRVVQGEEGAKPSPARAVALGGEGADWPALPASARVVLRTPLPLPPGLRSALYGGRETGRARLVTLWAHWCAPCLVELGRLAERSSELHALGLDVLPVNMDAPEDRETAGAVFETRIQERMGAPGFASMQLEEGPLTIVQVLLKDVIGARADEGVLPTSVLVDKNDMIAVVYLGPVEVDALIEDAIRFGTSPQQAGVRAAFEGRWFFGMPRNLEALADSLQEAGQRSAASFYRALLQLQRRR